MKISKIIKNTIIYTILILFAVITIFPFFWMITGSIKTLNEILSQPIVWWPKAIQWSNYQTVFEKAPFGIFFSNTVIVAFANTILTLFTTILAAFAFARLKFKGKKVLFVILLATLMIPSQLLIITNYLTISVKLHLLDTLMALILPYTASAFYIYLLKEFFEHVPDEYYFASKVDGCNDWMYLWKIVIPNTKNALITIGIFNWIASWNAYVWPLIVTNREDKRVLAIALLYFQGEAGANYELIMAAGTIVVLPLLILYLLARKYILEGIATGGIKA